MSAPAGYDMSITTVSPSSLVPSDERTVLYWSGSLEQNTTTASSPRPTTRCSEYSALYESASMAMAPQRGDGSASPSPQATPAATPTYALMPQTSSQLLECSTSDVLTAANGRCGYRGKSEARTAVEDPYGIGMSWAAPTPQTLTQAAPPASIGGGSGRAPATPPAAKPAQAAPAPQRQQQPSSSVQPMGPSSSGSRSATPQDGRPVPSPVHATASRPPPLHSAGPMAQMVPMAVVVATSPQRGNPARHSTALSGAAFCRPAANSPASSAANGGPGCGGAKAAGAAPASAPATTVSSAVGAPEATARTAATPMPLPVLPSSRIPPIPPLDGPRDSGNAGAAVSDTPAATHAALPQLRAEAASVETAGGGGGTAASRRRGTVPVPVKAGGGAGPTAPLPAAPKKKRGSRLNSAFANIGSAASGNRRAAGAEALRPRVRQVSFKEGDVVALPDSESLRTPMASVLVFRNPTMREQGKEMMPAPSEVYAQLLQRGMGVCSLAVVDEDAVRRPCLVASGFCVRVYEEEGAAAHGTRKAPSRRRSRGRTSKAEGGTNGQSDRKVVMTPERSDRRSGSSGDSEESRGPEFDRFLHKIVFDETVNRPNHSSSCESVTLELMAQRWELGQNTALILGNSSGRSIQCFDIATGVVRDALERLRGRLQDPASTAELQLHMGRVSVDDRDGSVRVQDLLVGGAEEESDSDSSSSDGDADAVTRTVSQAAAERAHLEFPEVRLSRSPVMGTFVKGLSTATAPNALEDASSVYRALGRGFHLHNVSTHPSRNGSFSNTQLAGSAANSGAPTCFAVLRLTTTCRGRDMRSAPLSSREATSVGEERRTKKARRAKGSVAALVTHHRTTECAADVFVSTLLVTFFGTDYQLFKTIVENRLSAAKQARGGAFVVAPEQLTYHAKYWTSPVHFLYSLLRDALGGRTHTVTCLCLSEYDAQVTPWMQVMERARAVVNMEANNGNLRSYLVYLLEQYENIQGQQRREKKGMGSRRSSGAVSDAAGAAAASRPSLPPGAFSLYFMQKLVNSLDAFLANPVGEPPLLERLEIRPADVLPSLPAPEEAPPVSDAAPRW